MFSKTLDRIQTAKMMRFDQFKVRKPKAEKNSEKNRAAGDSTTKAKANNAFNNTNNNAANTTPSKEKNKDNKNPIKEKVVKNNTNTVEANMESNPHVKDSNPGVIDLGSGVKIDQKKMCGADTDPIVSQTAVYNPGPVSNAYLDYLNNPIVPPYSVTPPPPGNGRHKVDSPKPPKPEVKKADADNVNVDLKNINIEVNPPKPPKMWPDSVGSPLPQAGPVEEAEPNPVFDNTAVTSRKNCRYLKDIENLALECKVQIQMIPRITPNGEDTGLISCLVYTPESNMANPYKAFTIDTGTIIDRRAKVFPGIVSYGYEDIYSYPVLIPKTDESGKNKNILNEKLFTDIFTGGIKMLETYKPMYNNDYMELNKYVALITLPTNHMNKETRTSIQNRLVKAMKAGVFKSALEADPGSRFRFKPGTYDKKNLSFVLTNENTPYRFCGPVCSTKGIEIVFSIGADGQPTTNINYL